jgi:8-oxo-dGTP pyrophosphatase MutT (NUDIX family)
MPISDYLRELRHQVGHRLLLMPGVAAVIRDDAGQILLMRRSDDGRWSLPAGATDPGEAPARTVIREVYEETGLIVQPTAILAVMGGEAFRTRYPNADEVEYTVIVFACEKAGGRLEPQDGEALELAWFAPDHLPPLYAPYPPQIFLGSRGPTLFAWDPSWLDELP